MEKKKTKKKGVPQTPERVNFSGGVGGNTSMGAAKNNPPQTNQKGGGTVNVNTPRTFPSGKRGKTAGSGKIKEGRGGGRAFRRGSLANLRGEPRQLSPTPKKKRKKRRNKQLL